MVTPEGEQRGKTRIRPALQMLPGSLGRGSAREWYPREPGRGEAEAVPSGRAWPGMALPVLWGDM